MSDTRELAVENKMVTDAVDVLLKRDSAYPIERMCAQWAHEISQKLGFACIVIPTAAGVIAYSVPRPTEATTVPEKG